MKTPKRVNDKRNDNKSTPISYMQMAENERLK